jgi:hypothetical protein
MHMSEELMRLSLYALSATLGGVGILLVYLSCYAPAFRATRAADAGGGLCPDPVHRATVITSNFT